MAETEKIWPPAPNAPHPHPIVPERPQASPLGGIAAMWTLTGAYLVLSCYRLPFLLPLPLGRGLVLACSLSSFALGLWLVMQRDTLSRLHGGARIGVSVLIAVFSFFHALIRF